MANHNIGHDVTHFVHDIRQFETTGRIQDTTWGRGGDPISTRRANNTMGYQLQRLASLQDDSFR
jgi:hypothetical protein